MGMFDAYTYLPTPPIPPFRELPEDYDELRKALRALYFSHESISRVAHSLWEKDGCPDGEQPAENLGWRVKGMKLREAHWWQAEMMLDVVLDTDISTVSALMFEWVRAGRPEGPIEVAHPA